MVRRRNNLVFREKLAVYKRIKRTSGHLLVDNGLNSIKSTVDGHEDIPQKVKDDISMLFCIIQEPFDEILSLFDDLDHQITVKDCKNL